MSLELVSGTSNPTTSDMIVGKGRWLEMADLRVRFGITSVHPEPLMMCLALLSLATLASGDGVTSTSCNFFVTGFDQLVVLFARNSTSYFHYD